MYVACMTSPGTAISRDMHAADGTGEQHCARRKSALSRLQTGASKCYYEAGQPGQRQETLWHVPQTKWTISGAASAGCVAAMAGFEHVQRRLVHVHTTRRSQRTLRSEQDLVGHAPGPGRPPSGHESSKSGSMSKSVNDGCFTLTTSMFGTAAACCRRPLNATATTVASGKHKRDVHIVAPDRLSRFVAMNGVTSCLRLLSASGLLQLD